MSRVDPLSRAFDARAHWEAVYRRAWQAGGLSRVQDMPGVAAAPAVVPDDERPLTRVRFARHRLALRRDHAAGRLRWANRDGLALCGLQALDATHNDLDDANPLYWGHVAHVAEGHAVQVLAAFRDGRHAGDLVVQLDGTLQRFVALHDLRVFRRRQGDGAAIVGALLASAGLPLRVVQAKSGMPAFWSAMGGNEFFDFYGNVDLSWEAWAHRRLGMPVGAAAHWEALYARDDAADWNDPVARQRRLRAFAFAADLARRRQAPPAD